MHPGSLITLDQKSTSAPWSGFDAVFQTLKVTNTRYAIGLYTAEHRSLQKLALCIESVPMSHYIRPMQSIFCLLINRSAWTARQTGGSAE